MFGNDMILKTNRPLNENGWIQTELSDLNSTALAAERVFLSNGLLASNGANFNKYPRVYY